MAPNLFIVLFFVWSVFSFSVFAQTTTPLPPSPSDVVGAPTAPPSVEAPSPSVPAPVQTVPASIQAPSSPPSSAPAPGQPKTDLLFILDVSGSMNSLLENNLMIEWAKKAIEGAVRQLPADAEVGLRVYAHRVDKANREESCKDTELMVPIGPGNGSLVAAAARGLKPKGWTPIAYSLEQSAGDFGTMTERLHTIILVSDGEETCGGDPLAAARGLLAKGFRIKIFTIGFNVDGVARKQLEDLAREFGGTYTDVRGGANLEQELTNLTQQTFLIEKSKPKMEENRIRGGDSVETAVPIQPNVFYQLDHHQRKGEYDYFSIELGPPQIVSLFVKPVRKCLTIEGDQVQEKEPNSAHSCSWDAMHLSLTDRDGRIVRDLSGFMVDQPTETPSRKIETKATYYLAVGSPGAAMHKDHSFKVVVEGDAQVEEVPQAAPLVEKPKAENEIRGGNSLASAVSIELNKKFKLDHHQRKGEYDYFVFTLPAGQGVTIQAFPVPKCVEIVGDQAQEQIGTFCYPEGYRLAITDGNGKEMTRIAEASVDRQKESQLVSNSSTSPVSYYLVVGSPMRDVDKDHEFMLVTQAVAVEEARPIPGDAGTERDAGSSKAAAIALTAGLYDSNHISKSDDVDLFKIAIPKGFLLKVVASSNEPYLIFGVMGELGERLMNDVRVKPGSSSPFESQPTMAGKTVYVRIANDHSYSQPGGTYSLGIELVKLPKDWKKIIKLAGAGVVLLVLIIGTLIIVSKLKRRKPS